MAEQTDLDGQFFSSVAAEFAQLDARFKSTQFSFFSIDERVLPGIEGKEDLFGGGGGTWHPYHVYVIRLHAGKLLRADTLLTGGNPNPKVHVRLGEVELPPAIYLLLCSPNIHHDAKVPERSIAQTTITTAVGVLLTFLGRGAVLAHVGDQTVAVEGKPLSYETGVIRVPQFEDLAYLLDNKIIVEIMSALGVMPTEKRESVLFPWSILGRAAREDDETFRFTLYWVALEVIADTQGDGVAAKLGNAYGKSRNFAYDELELRPAYDLRHTVVHKGARVSLEPRMERLLQCCFLDLVRARLNLPCRGIALAAAQGLGQRSAATGQ